MLHQLPKIADAAAFIRARWPQTPRAGIILGTGLGNLAASIESPTNISYKEIPHFPVSTAIGHKGQLVCGTLAGLPVVAMQGRFHFYEGYPMWKITLPVRVMKALGINLLIVSNACGGLNPLYRSGDVMVMEDHINLMLGNPLIGINEDSLGPRFPDMSQPYDRDLISRALEISRKSNFVAHCGTYAAVSGPNYETRAEQRFVRKIGGDVVGMSTVPEVIVAVHAGLRVLALSTVTNECRPDDPNPKPTTGEEVVAIGAAAEHKVRTIVLGVLEQEAKS
ncbi:MAG TPA: purine-nucleoside phosphorylase [Pirellulales bacterium]|jgi:purine-nucleoside phosphorylase|nr:purine-nucleoside phosphorylase [Pirellulales bacterium]